MDLISPVLLYVNQEVAELGTLGFANAMTLAAGKVDRLVKSLEKLDQSKIISPQMLASLNSKLKRELGEIERLAANGITDSLKTKSILAGQLATRHLRIELERFSDIFDAQILRSRIMISGSAIKSLAIGQKFGKQVVQDIKKSIAIGVPRKETIGQLVKRLKTRDLGKVYKSYADRLLSTEINREYNLLKLEGIRALNRQKRGGYLKCWNAIIDRRTCAECARLDGEAIKPDSNFPGGKMIPPIHPRCRCCIVVWRETWKSNS